MNEPGLQTNCDERKRERRVNLNYESETSKDTRKFLKKLNSQRDTRVSTQGIKFSVRGPGIAYPDLLFGAILRENIPERKLKISIF